MREARTTLDAALCRAFGAASGDDNAVHRDSDRVRRELGGRPVAYGGLGLLCALQLAAASGHRLERFVVDFTRPVVVGQTLTVRLETGEGAVPTVRGWVGDRLCVVVRPVTTPARPPAEPAADARPVPHPGLPAEAVADLRARFPDVPPDVLGAVLVASWYAGTQEPGDGTIIGRLELATSGAPGGGAPGDVGPDGPGAGRGAGTLWAVTPHARRDLVGGALVEVAAHLRGDAREADVLLTCVPPRAVAPCAPEAVADRLVELSGRLRGRRYLVVGGTRGLGRGACLALASLGADVIAVYRADDTAAASLAGAGLDGTITPVRADAGDVLALRAALDAVPEAPFDGALCCASPGIRPGLLADDPTAPAAVGSAVSTAWAQLDVAAAAVGDGGWVAYASSPVVGTCPPDWTAYGVEKAGGEWLVGQIARRAGLTPVVVRPPLMDTELSARVDPFATRVPVEDVAARFARWVVEDGTGAGAEPVVLDLTPVPA